MSNKSNATVETMYNHIRVVNTKLLDGDERFFDEYKKFEEEAKYLLNKIIEQLDENVEIRISPIKREDEYSLTEAQQNFTELAIIEFRKNNYRVAEIWNIKAVFRNSDNTFHLGGLDVKIFDSILLDNYNFRMITSHGDDIEDIYKKLDKAALNIVSWIHNN